jgi:hypothetical protein
MPLILGTNSIKDTGYDVDNSLRFNGSGSDDYLYKTFGSDGNRKTYTVSAWVKRAQLGRTQVIFFAGDNSTDSYPLHFVAGDNLEVTRYAGGYTFRVTTTRVFRDVSAWYHIVVAVDTTQATASNRVKIYVNGVQETAFDNSSYPAQDSQYEINDATYQHNWGFQTTNNDFDYGGYMAECVFIDGSALDATSFGEFDGDSGIWKPIDVSGLTFGSNGFYLDFEDSSALGNDVSGNNNDFTANNLTATDQSTDTCTNNFMTLNPLSTDSGVTLSEGNTESDYDASVGNAKGNIGLTRGRWYWEVKLTNSTSGYPMIGIGSMNEEQMQKPTGGSYPGGFSNSYGVYGTNLRLYANGINEGDQGSSYTTGDIFGIYLDLESSTKTIKWYKNGSLVLSDDITNAGDDYPYTCMDYNGGESSVNVNYNFGNPAYSISSGNSDDNGYGNFEYSPNISSTKYYAVCSKNLAEYG